MSSSGSATNKPFTSQSSMNPTAKQASPVIGVFSFSDIWKPESRGFLIRYGMVAFLVVFSCLMLYVTYGTPEATTKSFYFYLFMCTVPIAIAMYVASPLYSEKLTKTTLMLYAGAAIAILVGLYYFYAITNPTGVSLFTTFFTGFEILGIIVGLAILYRVLMRYVNMTRGWGGFLLQFIFYIPCLFIEFVQNIMDELRVAPNMVAVLFVIEILIVLGYLYLPKLMLYLRRDTAKQFIDSPVFLNKPYIVAKNEDLLLDKKDKSVPEKDVDLVRINYSLAFWVFINETQPNLGKEQNILSFSAPGMYNGKPGIKYVNGKMIVSLTNQFVSGNEFASVSLPNQKWNYVVITYDDNKADVYLNAELVSTVAFTAENMPEYSSTDVIQIGETDGIYGAIRDFVYYKTPIHLGEITNIYNVSKYTM